MLPPKPSPFAAGKAQPGKRAVAVPAPALRQTPNVRPVPVVQAKGATRLYPSLNPRMQMDVDRTQIGVLHSFFDEFRMTAPSVRGQALPNNKYIFVTDATGQIRTHPRYRHPVIAEGKPVLYAGEAEFRHGKLEWWSNASGNYKPDRRDAQQAGLPMERFFTHEQVRSGVHKRPPAAGQKRP